MNGRVAGTIIAMTVKGMINPTALVALATHSPRAMGELMVALAGMRALSSPPAMQAIGRAAATPGAYALVGMSAMVAGTTHATLTAMLIIFEMTGDYRIILPLMLASVLSTLLAHRLKKESIYTLKLVRKGISLKGGRDISILTSTFVREVMSRSWETISHSMPMGQLLRLVEESRFSFYPVVNSSGELEGILSLQDVKSLITKRGLEDLVIVKDVMPRYTQTLTEDETLASALQKFGLQDVEALPVVDEEDPGKLVGVLKRSDIITFYNKRLLERTGKS